MAAQTPLAFEPVHQLRDRMTKGEITPVDIVEGYLDRIARYDAAPRVHRYLRRRGPGCGARRGGRHGVWPSHRPAPRHPGGGEGSRRDRGPRDHGGCRAWHDRRSPYTATLVEKMVAAGMIVLGKTHTVQFAMGGWGPTSSSGPPGIRGTSRCIPQAVQRGIGVAVAAASRPGRSAPIRAAPCGSPPRGVGWSGSRRPWTDQHLRGAPAGSHAGYARPDSA